MSEKAEKKSRHLGTFSFKGDKGLLGELRIKGRKTSLRLLHSESIPRFIELGTLHGELQDLRKVSCLQCLQLSSGSNRGLDGRRSHYAQFLPHFVAIGDQHLHPEERCIKEVSFTVDDIESIFHDFDAFGSVFEAKPLIEAVAMANGSEREIRIGESPLITYFTGRFEVIAVQTAIGAFTVRHAPSSGMGGPGGVFIKNRMSITLEPSAPIDFDDCIERLLVFLRFLSALAGREQAPRAIRLKLSGQQDDRIRPLRLHWSYRPRGNKNKGGSSILRPHPTAIPLDAVRRPDEFTAVLRHWIARDPTWQSARVRYAGCLEKANSYDVDRLVAAANMFDLLPQEAVPISSTLPPELEKAQKDCLAILKGQANGMERDGAIDALKRMNRPSLPKRVLHRVAIVDGKLGHLFPELAFVAKTAVKVRNHFVHGNSDSFDFNAVEQMKPFFTDALEFIFCASDLIEAGWDANAWSQDPSTWGHPFARFKSQYRQSLEEIKRSASAPAKSTHTKA